MKPLRADLGILLWMLVLGFATFLIRIWFPPDEWIWMLGFLEAECARLPQYISLFVLGIVAYHKNLIWRVPSRSGFLWGLMGLLLLCLSSVFPQDIAFLAFGLNWAALVAAFNESLLCTGLCIGLITVFRNFFDHGGPFFRMLSRNSFSVYIIHIPILLAVQWPISLLELGPAHKFLITLFLAAPLSFVLSHIIRTRMPCPRSIP